ncbi:MAG: DUF1376 domain-containing protein [Mesoflavibacter sp.]|nr:DUF1376 domain-containing protein [Mesoflavibacter sp.]
MKYFSTPISSFSRQTMGLNDEQKGAFFALALLYFETEKPIPGNINKTAKLLGISNLKNLTFVIDLMFQFDKQSKTYDCKFLKEILDSEKNPTKKQKITKV